MTKLAILGAGPAGLTAALEAAEAGHDVVLFEAADHVGGMAGSFDIDGIRVDYGSHRLHPATDARFMNRFQTLLGDDLQRRERNGRIRLRNRWVGFPLRMLDMVRSLPTDFSASVALDTIKGLAPSEPGATFADEITRRLGPAIFREFYGPYAKKLYGLDAHQLDVELADRRVAASSPLAILRKVIGATRSEARVFWYPKQGYGQLCERLADAAIDAGVDLRLKSPVQAVAASGDWVQSTTTERCDLVLSTLPATTLAKVIDDQVPAAVATALAQLRTRSMVLVYLTLPTAQYTPFDAHYFPETEIAMSRLSEPKNYRDGPDPADRTVLCGEYPCWPESGDPVWSASDQELAALMTRDLERSGLPPIAPNNVTVRRLPSVYPVYEPGLDQARQRVDDWLTSHPGLLTFGRQGLWVPDNLHHVMAMGRAALRTIGDEGIDRQAWSEAQRAFDQHVVQD